MGDKTERCPHIDKWDQLSRKTDGKFCLVRRSVTSDRTSAYSQDLLLGGLRPLFGLGLCRLGQSCVQSGAMDAKKRDPLQPTLGTHYYLR